MEELKTQPIIAKTSVETFGDECAYQAHTMLCVEPGKPGQSNLYLHLSGYNIAEKPIGLRVLLNEVPTESVNENMACFLYMRNEVDEYLNKRGLEVLEGTFNFPPNMYIGEIGSLNQEPRGIPF